LIFRAGFNLEGFEVNFKKARNKVLQTIKVNHYESSRVDFWELKVEDLVRIFLAPKMNFEDSKTPIQGSLK